MSIRHQNSGCSYKVVKLVTSASSQRYMKKFSAKSGPLQLAHRTTYVKESQDDAERQQQKQQKQQKKIIVFHIKYQHTE